MLTRYDPPREAPIAVNCFEIIPIRDVMNPCIDRRLALVFEIRDFARGHWGH